MNNITLNEIKTFAEKEYRQSKDKQHDFGHAERVAKNAQWIVDMMRVGEKLDTNLLLAACYLHDVVITRKFSRNYFTQLYNHIFEKRLNKRFLRQILEYFNLPTEENQILMTAIVNHPYSIPYRILNKQSDTYSKVLQDADSLDYVSLKRENSFIQGKGKLLTYFANFYVSWVRRNFRKYLNYPELVNGLTNGFVTPEEPENTHEKNIVADWVLVKAVEE